MMLLIKESLYWQGIKNEWVLFLMWLEFAYCNYYNVFCYRFLIIALSTLYSFPTPVKSLET